MSLVVMKRKLQAKQNATKRNNSSTMFANHLSNKCCGSNVGFKNNVNTKNLSYHSLMKRKVKCESSSDKITNVKRKYRVNNRLSSSEHLRLKLDRIMYKNKLDKCNPKTTSTEKKCTVPMLSVHYTRHNDKCVVTKDLNLSKSYKDLYNKVIEYDPCNEVENAENAICSLT